MSKTMAVEKEGKQDASNLLGINVQLKKQEIGLDKWQGWKGHWITES